MTRTDPQRFDPQLVIETPRLILRPSQPEDFDAFCAMMGDAQSARFIGGRMDRATAWRAWCSMIGAWHMRGYAMFSMILKDGGDWVGRTGPWYPEGWPGREVGWGVRREYAGMGLAQEAAIASLDHVFVTLGWEDVIHIIDPENTASIRLAQRLGAQNRGPTRMPQPFENARVDAWGQSRAQWMENRAKLP